MSAFIITGAKVNGDVQGAIAVRDGIIVDPADLPAGAIRLDAEGLVLLPGLVDLHTHLREPGREDAETIESGSRAAARGGWVPTPAFSTLPCSHQP